jgi:hypothetical protein
MTMTLSHRFLSLAMIFSFSVGEIVVRTREGPERENDKAQSRTDLQSVPQSSLGNACVNDGEGVPGAGQGNQRPAGTADVRRLSYQADAAFLRFAFEPTATQRHVQCARTLFDPRRRGGQCVQ